jgi:hypothetical protein
MQELSSIETYSANGVFTALRRCCMWTFLNSQKCVTYLKSKSRQFENVYSPQNSLLTVGALLSRMKNTRSSQRGNFTRRKSLRIVYIGRPSDIVTVLEY